LNFGSDWEFAVKPALNWHALWGSCSVTLSVCMWHFRKAYTEWAKKPDCF